MSKVDKFFRGECDTIFFSKIEKKEIFPTIRVNIMFSLDFVVTNQ